MHSPDAALDTLENNEHADDAERKPAYRAPRIDIELLTIVVHPSPYSKRTPLGRSRKSTLRRRWSS